MASITIYANGYANDYANEYAKTYGKTPALLDGEAVAAWTQLRVCIPVVGYNVYIPIVFYKLDHDVR